MSASLVGSEMCIRDRKESMLCLQCDGLEAVAVGPGDALAAAVPLLEGACLLYTSDAADDM
eukprot:13707203-Alexandrium_andersonii.AAC.1